LEPDNVKILVVDDHRLFLEGLRHLLLGLGSDVQLDLVESVEEAIIKIDQGNSYQLLVMDIALPKIDGFSLLKSLSERKICIPTVVISASSRLSDIRRVMNLGALGFIHKNTSSEDMLAAVRTVLKGEIHLPDDVWPKLKLYPTALDTKQEEGSAGNEAVGERQFDVLKLIKDGLSNKQISGVLNIGESTVKYHVSILFKHFEVNSRTALVKHAQEQKIL
jgi:DNA-binding NarL/FixJ family response regulator